VNHDFFFDHWNAQCVSITHVLQAIHQLTDERVGDTLFAAVRRTSLDGMPFDDQFLTADGHLNGARLGYDSLANRDLVGLNRPGSARVRCSSLAASPATPGKRILELRVAAGFSGHHTTRATLDSELHVARCLSGEIRVLHVGEGPT
jgi:hypothetical protein